eukprot:4684103-Pyramimonas_sp.AAC.1
MLPSRVVIKIWKLEKTPSLSSWADRDVGHYLNKDKEEGGEKVCESAKMYSALSHLRISTLDGKPPSCQPRFNTLIVSPVKVMVRMFGLVGGAEN